MNIIPRSKDFALYSNKENSQVRMYITQGEYATTLANFTLYDGSTALDLTNASQILFSVYFTHNRNTATTLPVEITDADDGKISVATVANLSANYDGNGMDCFVQAIFPTKTVKFSGMKIYVKADPSLDVLAQTDDAHTLIDAINKLALINGGTGTIEVDDALSTTSTKPVQNKKITQKINEMDNYLSGYSFLYDSFGRIYSYTWDTNITKRVQGVTNGSFGNDVNRNINCYVWLSKNVVSVEEDSLPDVQYIKGIRCEGDVTLPEQYNSLGNKVQRGRSPLSVFYMLASLAYLYNSKLEADERHTQLSNQILTEAQNRLDGYNLNLQKINNEIADREEIDEKTVFFEVLSGANTSTAKINELANDEKTIYRVMINYEWGFLHNIISNSKHSQIVFMDSGKILFRTKAPNTSWVGFSFTNLIPTKLSDLTDDSDYLVPDDISGKEDVSNKQTTIPDNLSTEDNTYPTRLATKQYIDNLLSVLEQFVTGELNLIKSNANAESATRARDDQALSARISSEESTRQSAIGGLQAELNGKLNNANGSVKESNINNGAVTKAKLTTALKNEIDNKIDKENGVQFISAQNANNCLSQNTLYVLQTEVEGQLQNTHTMIVAEDIDNRAQYRFSVEGGFEYRVQTGLLQEGNSWSEWKTFAEASNVSDLVNNLSNNYYTITQIDGLLSPINNLITENNLTNKKWNFVDVGQVFRSNIFDDYTDPDTIYVVRIAAVNSLFFTINNTQVRYVDTVGWQKRVKTNDIWGEWEGSIYTGSIQDGAITQDKLASSVYESIPTSASSKLITSGGVYNYVAHSLSISLEVSNWNNKMQVFDLSQYDITENTKIELDISDTVYSQLDSCGCESISAETIEDNNSMKVVIAIEGKIPTSDITIGLILSEAINLDS